MDFEGQTTDKEKIMQCSNEAVTEKFNETNSTALDCKRFNASGIGIKRKRRGKIQGHASNLNNNDNISMETGKNFDAFANDD